MKVILRKDIASLGKAEEIVQVADGYARNYLIPKGLAWTATSRNMAAYEQEKRQKALRNNKSKRDAQGLAEELERISLTATVSVGDEDRMFGSVTSQTIANLLGEKGYDIDRRKILLDDSIRALGIYNVPVRLLPDVEAKVKLWVVKE
ncbi:MAG: 50S ribosomal protein L9 [Candidatus Latescibacterota bacterium]|nr:50S ribosomal protein L9 [Candidatus Latescibacterota bacterium]OPX25520.1 MAG: 50S ribosomal protein L9 [Candidatus Latescibacteria bacterium 4484_107]RKY70258.1 MAG: 50S ribosomal protein L9 [Candidatus Latescibacterota bacterium]